MKIDIDPQINATTVPELAKAVSQKLAELFAKLQNQPNFHLDIDPSTPLPANLASQTIVFQLSAHNTLKLGIWNGKNLNLTS